MKCNNCNGDFTTKYCQDCGRPSTVKRIDRAYLIHEIEHVLHYDRGIIYTIKTLFLNPGSSIKEYLQEDRSKLMKPIVYLILTSLVYSIVTGYFKIDERFVNFSTADKNTGYKIFQWIEDHYGYANIIIGIFITLWLKLFFRKFPFNFFEVLILLCFVMGTDMIIFSFFALLQGVFKIKLIAIGGIVGVIYCSWAIGQFFGKQKYVSYVKGFLSYLLGLLTFLILTISIGIFIDVFFKNPS